MELNRCVVHFRSVSIPVMPNHFHTIIKIIGADIAPDDFIPVGAGSPCTNANNKNPNVHRR